MQAIDIANAQHTLSIVHEFLGFRKASKKEIVALRLGTLGPFNSHSFFWRCA